jgi:hypothetical protein
VFEPAPTLGDETPPDAPLVDPAALPDEPPLDELPPDEEPPLWAKDGEESASGTAAAAAMRCLRFIADLQSRLGAASAL